MLLLLLLLLLYYQEEYFKMVGRMKLAVPLIILYGLFLFNSLQVLYHMLFGKAYVTPS
jgi:hypothetical protein